MSDKGGNFFVVCHMFYRVIFGTKSSNAWNLNGDSWRRKITFNKKNDNNETKDYVAHMHQLLGYQNRITSLIKYIACNSSTFKFNGLF